MIGNEMFTANFYVWNMYLIEVMKRNHIPYYLTQAIYPSKKSSQASQTQNKQELIWITLHVFVCQFYTIN
jgi:hypothetical protein